MAIPFTREELVTAIASGDDSKDNSVVVDTNGKISIVPLNNAIGNPTYAVRNETFDSGNDYVGKDASEDDTHIDQVFDSISKAWEKYLITGEQVYADGTLI